MTKALLFTSAPMIETKRLILRAHNYRDFDDYQAMVQDETFIRYTFVIPLPKEDAWTKMIRHGGHWACLGHGYWAIEEKATGSFMGEIGFADFKRDITPSLEGKMEAGWGLVSRAHGKGFASEALKAILHWRDEYFPNKEVVCMIAPQNIASIRLAEAHGFIAWTETFYKKTYETKLFRRP